MPSWQLVVGCIVLLGCAFAACACATTVGDIGIGARGEAASVVHGVSPTLPADVSAPVMLQTNSEAQIQKKFAFLSWGWWIGGYVWSWWASTRALVEKVCSFRISVAWKNVEIVEKTKYCWGLFTKKKVTKEQQLEIQYGQKQYVKSAPNGAVVKGEIAPSFLEIGSVSTKRHKRGSEMKQQLCGAIGDIRSVLSETGLKLSQDPGDVDLCAAICEPPAMSCPNTVSEDAVMEQLGAEIAASFVALRNAVGGFTSVRQLVCNDADSTDCVSGLTAAQAFEFFNMGLCKDEEPHASALLCPNTATAEQLQRFVKSGVISQAQAHQFLELRDKKIDESGAPASRTFPFADLQDIFGRIQRLKQATVTEIFDLDACQDDDEAHQCPIGMSTFLDAMDKITESPFCANCRHQSLEQNQMDLDALAEELEPFADGMKCLDTALCGDDEFSLSGLTEEQYDELSKTPPLVASREQEEDFE
eukprot:gnl/Hemi2/17914_TR5910_c0_g5_i1.p1 gnl/Hemi2/17914_TR5910_c0_g5~~gnl/Hemi2/17914_TR5910_c0_g5_i1.p1  ORF type:complete len:474 (-),score=82.91 gnl/Hemi2/17914_TR5910_c0_g5_i1:37-1458(-)